MATSSDYFLFSPNAYETLPVTSAFLEKRGPLYFPAVGNDEPVLMTTQNTTVKQAYEAKYPGMLCPIIDLKDGNPPQINVAYEKATLMCLEIPNASEKERTQALEIAKGRVTRAIMLPLDEFRRYKLTGIIPKIITKL